MDGQHIDKWLSEMTEDLEREQSILDEAQANVAKLTGAIAALKGDTQPKPQQRRRRAAPGEGNGKVSQEAVDRVLHAITEAGDQGITKDGIQAATGLSHAPVGNALTLLRETERVRKAGVDGETRRHIFKVMPDA